MSSGTRVAGVFTVPRRKIADDLGAVYHVMRNDSAEFLGFGETYVSTLRGRSVKAWKRHRVMQQSITVPLGRVRFVIYDGREDSPTKGTIQILELGDEPYSMLRIPPGVWYGFGGLTDQTSVIVNCATIPHDPLEVDRLPLESAEIPYSWTRDGAY